MPAPLVLPTIQVLPAPAGGPHAGGVETALFGYRLPYLPDFLADNTLLAERPPERMAEALGRMVRFVLGLRKYRDSAYALRYVARRGAEGELVHVIGGGEQAGQRRPRRERPALGVAAGPSIQGQGVVGLLLGRQKDSVLARRKFDVGHESAALSIVFDAVAHNDHLVNGSPGLGLGVESNGSVSYTHLLCNWN